MVHYRPERLLSAAISSNEVIWCRVTLEVRLHRFNFLLGLVFDIDESVEGIAPVECNSSWWRRFGSKSKQNFLSIVLVRAFGGDVVVAEYIAPVESTPSWRRHRVIDENFLLYF
jgi:hypothetical protein